MPSGWYRYPLKRPKNWQDLKKAKTKWYHQNDFTFPLFFPPQREKFSDQMLIYNKLINPDGKTRKVDKMYSINQKKRRKIKNLTKVTIINRKYFVRKSTTCSLFPWSKISGIFKNENFPSVGLERFSFSRRRFFLSHFPFLPGFFGM